MESTFSWNTTGGSFDIGAMFTCRTFREPRRVHSEPNTYERSTADNECHGCNQLKPAVEYSTNKKNRIGHSKFCKQCTQKIDHDTTTDKQKCKQCEQILVPTEFARDKRNKSGLKSKCKQCYTTHSYDRTIEDTVCSKCKKLLPAIDYFTTKHNPSGIQGSCKECIRQYNRSRAQSKRNPHVEGKTSIIVSLSR
jgi:hypothetical protein